MVLMSRNTRLVSTINRATIGPLAKRYPKGVSLLRGADSGPRLDDGWVKAQPAGVHILKRFRKQGHGFKSHPTDCEKPGIKPGPPGLQDICYRRCNSLVCEWSCSLDITSNGRVGLCFFVVSCTGDDILACGRVPWLYQYWPGGFMILW